MVNNTQFTAEMNTAVAVLRALLTSSHTKDGIPTKQLLIDYQNVEGQLPLKKFGFDTIDDFLAASKEFILQRGRDGVRVLPHKNVDSAHITKLLEQQKSSRKQKSTTVLEPRRPIRTQSNRDENKWRSGSAFSDIYSRLPSRSVKKAVASTYNNNQTGQITRKVANNKSANGNGLDETTTMAAQKSSNGAGNESGKRAITKQTNAGRFQGQTKSNNAQPTASRANAPKSSGNASTDGTTTGRTNNLHSTATKYETNTVNEQKKQQRDNVAARNANSIPKMPSNGNSVQKSSLNSRLIRLQSAEVTVDEIKNNRNSNNNNIDQSSNSEVEVKKTNNLTNRLAKLQTSDQTKTIVRTLDVAKNKYSTNMKNLEDLEPSSALHLYCIEKGYDPPQYKFYRIKATRRIHCRVQVNNCLYATYPDDFVTEAEAKTVAAKTAFDQLREHGTKVETPVCMDNDIEMAIKILDCIKAMTNGVFKKNIPQIFQDAFGQTLPDNWFNAIADNPLMFNIEDAVGDHKIIYPNCAASPTSTLSYDEIDNAPSNINKPLVNDLVHSDALTLPWQEKYWNLYITHPRSTVEVWARIIGPEFSTKMDSIITDIELSLLTDKKQAEQIVVGKIYLVSITECWYRVRVDKNDYAKNRCHCFFIDVGDEDWFAMDEIFVCDPKFQKFPAQAICFSLIGLEDFAGNPHAAHQIDEMLANKVLIGEILTKSDDYIAQDKSNDLQAKIQIELYDTSSQDDVRLNPLILDKICENTVEPVLDRKKMNLVYISHVSDNGDIYCLLQQSRNSLHYINKVIHQLTETGSTCEKFRNSSAVNVKNRNIAQGLYLIYDKNDKQWYRAAVSWDKSGSKPTELCKCVDYGFEKMIELENIYRLDMLSAALHKYPLQAIGVKLNDIDKFDESVIKRLRGLLLPNAMTPNTFIQSEANTIVIIVEGSNMPLVNIFKRMAPSNILYRINDTIRLEQELENCADIILDPEETFDASNITNNLGQNKPNSLKRSLSGIKPYPTPSPDNFFNVFVTMASNPGNFIIRSHNDEQEFRALMDDLQHYCQQCNDIPTEEQLQPGNNFAALNQDNVWYRVILDKALSPMSVIVFSCDYGEIIVSDAEKLRLLPDKFKRLPQLAIRGKLHGVQPKNKDWNTNDCTRFQELVVGKSFASEIKTINHETNDQKFVLDLVLIDVSTSEDIYLHKILIDEGRAVCCE